MCNVCGEPTARGNKYCSDRCRHVVKPNSANMGTVGELLVCADLLRKGYDVFKAVSHGAAVDLIACKDDICLRIEVKHLSTTAITHTAGIADARLRHGKFDILAVVRNDSVQYFDTGLALTFL